MKESCALIDLHLHLDGSLPLEAVRALAREQGIPLPEDLERVLQVSPDCKDLNEYLEKFDLPCALLQTEKAITGAVRALRKELEAQGLLYAEIRFAPQLHTGQGLKQRQVIRAAVAGLEGEGVPANLILCAMRLPDNGPENAETVQLAAEFLGKGVCALDLAGAEALFPTEGYRELFELAKTLGVPYTIHAGEAAGPESVRCALDFGTKRIGHGVRSVEDRELLCRLAREGVTLELCPTSNLQTAIYPDLNAYPLPELLDAGVRITVNTDNMTVSHTTLEAEWQNLLETFPLTKTQIAAIVHNAAEASFLTPEQKIWLHRQIDLRLKNITER